MTSTSAYQKFSGLLVVVGSCVFVGGGAFHPKINSTLGAIGSSEFFTNFYMHIAHHSAWETIHGMILAGPLLWLLGIALIRDVPDIQELSVRSRRNFPRFLPRRAIQRRTHFLF